MLVAQFFRSNQVDPYGLEHAVINDYRRWLLLEIRGPKGKERPKAVAMAKLAELKRFEIADLRRQHPLKDEEPDFPPT